MVLKTRQEGFYRDEWSSPLDANFDLSPAEWMELAWELPDHEDFGACKGQQVWEALGARGGSSLVQSIQPSSLAHMLQIGLEGRTVAHWARIRPRAPA